MCCSSSCLRALFFLCPFPQGFPSSLASIRQAGNTEGVGNVTIAGNLTVAGEMDILNLGVVIESSAHVRVVNQKREEEESERAVVQWTLKAENSVSSTNMYTLSLLLLLSAFLPSCFVPLPFALRAQIIVEQGFLEIEFNADFGDLTIPGSVDPFQVEPEAELRMRVSDGFKVMEPSDGWASFTNILMSSGLVIYEIGRGAMSTYSLIDSFIHPSTGAIVNTVIFCSIPLSSFVFSLSLSLSFRRSRFKDSSAC